MATPGDLVQSVAEALGIPVPTVAQYDLRLAAAGLRTKGGRGISAAKMGPRDAAHLLTSLLGTGMPGSPQVRDCEEVVQRYAEAIAHEHTDGSPGFSALPIPRLATLPPQHSFIDGVEAVIASIMDGSFLSATHEGVKNAYGEILDFYAGITVWVATPGPLADIRIAGTRPGTSAAIRYLKPTPYSSDRSRKPTEAELEAWRQSLPEEWPPGDLEQHRRITERTLFAVAKTLNN